MQGSFVFIVGSPRSGTTVLGEILDRHDAVSQWYEPYFVWDRHFRLAAHDQRTAADAEPQVASQIYKDFSRFRQKSGSRIIVDKSPRNSLKIPFILRIFPEARFVHIIRDGRDTTLSIHKEWMRRRRIAQGNNNRFQNRKAFQVLSEWLGRQRFFRHKVRALWFETHFNMYDKRRHLNRRRWNGEIGWGPRFSGWEKYYRDCTLLQFNAYQWLKCVENIAAAWPDVRYERKLTIRYEDLITRPKDTIDSIISFLDLDLREGFYQRIPRMKQNNFNKWQLEFDSQQLKEINDIIAPMLENLGYTDDLRTLSQ